MVASEENTDLNKELEKIKEENEKLKERLESKEEEIRQYKEGVANKSVIERWKIGKYLHDNLAQQLTSAKISINLLKEKLSRENLTAACEEILNILDESIKEVRDLSHDIIPMDVEKEGVGQAFKHLQYQAEQQHDVSCTLETDRILDKINRREVATNLYNITQEAIKNAIVHGEAKNIKIVLIEHNEQLYLHIKDDGKGFEPTNGKGGGMGLSIMEHRAEEMGGNFRIKKAQENSEYSTIVTCSLPLKAIKDD